MIRFGAFVAILGLFSGGGALAQDQGAPNAAPWTANCVSGGRSAAPLCQVEQRVVLAATGQLLTAVAIRFDGDNAGAELNVQVPFGLYLPSGLRLTLGADSLLDVPLVTCDAAGCYGVAMLDDDMLERLGGAAELTVTFEDMARNAVGVPVALLGFAEAVERAR